jgi:hypothetical protein
MQLEKASRPLWAVVVVAVVVEATLATLGELLPPPQPAASSDSAATGTAETRMSGRHRTGRTVESRPVCRVALERCLSTAAER